MNETTAAALEAPGTIATKPPGKTGPPETITPQDVEIFLDLLREGLSDEMAAACVNHSSPGMKDYCNKRPTLALRLGKAKASKALQHLKNLDRISNTDDVRGLNAAEKASEAMLRANDPRFRKDPDSMTGAGSGVTIIIKSEIPAPSGNRFVEGGGMIDAEAVEVLSGRGVELSGSARLALTHTPTPPPTDSEPTATPEAEGVAVEAMATAESELF